MKIEKQIQELEESLLKSEVRSSQSKLKSLLADCFVEFGASGTVWNKDSIIGSLTSEIDDQDIHFDAYNFSTSILSGEIVHITYQCDRLNSEGKITRKTLRSSIWQLINQKWQIIFHQGTVVNN